LSDPISTALLGWRKDRRDNDDMKLEIAQFREQLETQHNSALIVSGFSTLEEGERIIPLYL
jgi:hypothetical protein